MMVIKYKKIFLTISALLVALSLGAMVIYGFSFSIEFTGGSIIEVSYDERIDKAEVEEFLSEHVNSFSLLIQPSGENNFIIRAPFLEEDAQENIFSSLEESGAEIERVSAVGPVIGQELKEKALLAIIVVMVAIILFIAFAFRGVSEPVSSWKYGLVAILALVHDILIPTGIFVVLGSLLGYQIDLLFVAALLAILGFSVNDTIVVFDRIRENLKNNQETGLAEDFKDTVGKSLSQTYARSINTSLTTLLPLILLLFIGSESTRHFALVMVIGIIAGVYSSIFLASPLLVILGKGRKKTNS